MDNTGYPYPVFGRTGRYLILLVDNAVLFGKRGTISLAKGVPKVIAGCSVEWSGRS